MIALLPHQKKSNPPPLSQSSRRPLLSNLICIHYTKLYQPTGGGTALTGGGGGGTTDLWPHSFCATPIGLMLKSGIQGSTVPRCPIPPPMTLPTLSATSLIIMQLLIGIRTPNVAARSKCRSWFRNVLYLPNVRLILHFPFHEWGGGVIH